MRDKNWGREDITSSKLLIQRKIIAYLTDFEEQYGVGS